MSTRRKSEAAQLGFDALLANAESANLTRQIERECAHLPGTMIEGVPFFRALIDRHHAAMMAGDADAAMQLREEADRLATKLNNYEPGILANDDSPGKVLDRVTRAPDGTVPLWGQSGSFEIACARMRVRIEMDGIFGISAGFYHWLGFDAHAVEYDRPFLSPTGYRSFVAIGGALEPGFTPGTLALAVITGHVQRELKGKLFAIKPEYRQRKSEPAS
jgi:hypothetical protein